MLARNTLERRIIKFVQSVAAISLAATAWCMDLPPSARAADAHPAVDFARDIQPIFAARCYDCHGEKKQKSGFRLDDKAVALRGGDSGKPAIVPGKSAESSLIHRITSTD